jgi:hypothetical protein
MGRPRFRSLRRTAALVIGLLAAQAVAHVASIDAILDRRTLIERASRAGGVTWEDLDAVSARWVGAGRWGLLLLIATAGVWCSWQFHAHGNLVRRHVEGLRHTPGWAVGWWFVPLANLWKPYRAMSELARASASPESWRDARPPRILFPWWVAWIAGTSITRIVASQGGPMTEEAARRLDLALVSASVCSILAAILACAIVWSITLAQEEMAEAAPPLFDEPQGSGPHRPR